MELVRLSAVLQIASGCGHMGGVCLAMHVDAWSCTTLQCRVVYQQRWVPVQCRGGYPLLHCHQRERDPRVEHHVLGVSIEICKLNIRFSTWWHALQDTDRVVMLTHVVALLDIGRWVLL
jgi:hypothetical protein